MPDIGYYTLPVILSFEGVDKQVNGALGNTLDAAGVKGGKQFAKGVAGGVRSGEADVKRALEQYSDHYEKLKDKAEDSLGKIRTAEAQLAQARNSGNQARIVAAEERVATARRNSTRTTRDAENALKDYERAAKDAENAGKDLGTGLSGGLMASLRGAAGAAKEAGSEAGSGFVAGFSPAMSKLGGKGGAIGIGILATVGVYYAIGKKIAAETMEGMRHEFAADQVQAQIGLDDQQMKVVSGAAGKAYANNFGESVEQNLDVAKVAFQTGLLDPNANQADIQKFVEQMNTVTAVTGEDAQAIARSVSQAVKTGMVPNVESGFNLIVKAQQKGLNASEDILDTITEYSTQFRKLGIDGPTALGLINQGLQGGARDADVVADALKEFSIRAIDGSKATGEAYTALGLNIDETSQKLAAGGPVAAQTFDTILDKLRAIEDPVKRNQIGVALFGTQWEDLGAAINSLDLSSATQQLGDVEGATQRAADTMGGNAVSSIEGAKRSIEVAARGIQDSLAEAFGPQIAEWANVVKAHQPEIIGFFVTLADVGLAVMQDLVKSIGGAVVAFGQLVGGLGNTLGRITQGIALVNDALGRHDIADQLRKDAEAQFGWGEGIQETGRKIEQGADKIGTARERIREQGEAAQRTARATEALGDIVKLLPDGKTITITENTPEVQQNLADVGLKIETLPDGTFVVVANTEEGQRDLDAWRTQQTGKPVEVTVEPKIDPTKADAEMKAFFDRYPVLNPNRAPAPPQGEMLGPFAAPPGGFQAPKPRAAGGVFSNMPTNAVIQPATAGLVQWAEPSTKGEAFIPLGGGERSRQIWAETGKRLGVFSFEQGGFYGPDVRAARGMTGTPYSQANRNDCSGMVARVISRAMGLPEQGLMSTKNARKWLAERGFKEGTGGPGTISVGWYDHGPNPNDGHMAMTLSDGTNAEAGGANGEFTVGGNAAGANSPQFDQHMFLPNLYGEGAAGASGYGGFGGSGGSGGGGTPGIGPNGEAGTYAPPDAKSLREAEQKVTDADARVKEAEAKQRELEADAKESQKLSAQNDVDKARRDAADARADLDETKKGKFKAAKDSSGSSSSGQGGTGQFGELGGILGSFMKETFGFDGSFFPDISNLMPVKMASGLLNAFKGPLQGAVDGKLGIQQAGWQPGMPVNGVENDTGIGNVSPSSAPFGMPDIGVPGAPQPDAPHAGTGNAPGPVQNIDQSITYNAPVGSDPEAVRKNNMRMQEQRAVPRITGTPAGVGN